MKPVVKHYSDVELEKVPDNDMVKGVSVQWLLGKHEKTPNFAERLFTVEVGGHTPRHAHDWEHEVFIVSGSGTVMVDEKEYPIGSGTFAFVPPNVMHQFRNTGDEPLKFLCMVPNGAK